MKICSNCSMPETKPNLGFEGDLCDACTRNQNRKNIDYKQREEEFESLLERHRGNGAEPDCICTVSGGKDSYFQVNLLKEHDMNPLLICVADPFTKTEAGQHNLLNLQDVFDCDLIIHRPSPALVRKTGRIAFEKYLMPNWAIDQAIYATPLREGLQRNLPLIFYGENVNYEYGGLQSKDTPSAKEQINNTVVKPIDFSHYGITIPEMLKYPTNTEKLNPTYISYFFPWDGYSNYQVAKQFGFRTLKNEWEREGFITDYDQIDSVGYLVHPWLKYPKYGFGRATDEVGYLVRSGLIEPEDGRKLIQQHDHKLDQRALQDFCRFFGYTEAEFWRILEPHWNRNIFEKVNRRWRKKPSSMI